MSTLDDVDEARAAAVFAMLQEAADPGQHPRHFDVDVMGAAAGDASLYDAVTQYRAELLRRAHGTLPLVRTIRLNERMHALLVELLDDVCEGQPHVDACPGGDVSRVRKLRQIVRSARIDRPKDIP